MNDTLHTVHFAAGSQSISIVVDGPVYESDPNERRATIVARAGPFHADLATTVWWYELRTLHEDLQRLYAAVGHEAECTEWRGSEGALVLAFELNLVGHVLVHVTMYDPHDRKADTTLAFTLRADQTYLPEWIRQTKQVW